MKSNIYDMYYKMSSAYNIKNIIITFINNCIVCKCYFLFEKVENLPTHTSKFIF